MPTEKQKLGTFGEKLVAKHCTCPKCKKPNTLKALLPNFKCADIVCDFCGFVAQVKSKTVSNTTKLPATILGAAWGPQRKRMDAGIYFPLYIVLVNSKKFAMYYLSADLQTPEMFVPRKPLSSTAKRAGWQGFYYDLRTVPEGSIIKL